MHIKYKKELFHWDVKNLEILRSGGKNGRKRQKCLSCSLQLQDKVFSSQFCSLQTCFIAFLKKTKSELKRQCKAINNYHIGLKYFACYKLTNTGFWKFWVLGNKMGFP